MKEVACECCGIEFPENEILDGLCDQCEQDAYGFIADDCLFGEDDDFDY